MIESPRLGIEPSSPRVQRLKKKRKEVRWVVVGLKTTDEVGCLNTLMISLNEVISETYAQVQQNA